MIETNAVYKLLESRIGAKGIEARTQEDTPRQPRTYLFFRHELMAQERLMSGKDG
jgi:hypothetical protein